MQCNQPWQRLLFSAGRKTKQRSSGRKKCKCKKKKKNAQPMHHANLTLVRQSLCTWVSPDELGGGGEAVNIARIIMTFPSSASSGKPPRGGGEDSFSKQLEQKHSPCWCWVTRTPISPLPGLVSPTTRCSLRCQGMLPFQEMLFVMFASPLATTASGWGPAPHCSLLAPSTLPALINHHHNN